VLPAANILDNMSIEQKLLRVRVMQREPKWGVRTIKKVIDNFGSLDAVFDGPLGQWKEASGPIKVIRQKASRPGALLEARREYERLQHLEIRPVFYGEPDYPVLLAHCPDAPAVLFVRGKLDWGKSPIVSIVGTRRATRRGIALCEQLIEDLAPLKPTIVSGFAYGVDIAAHKKAMTLGLQSIGCMAHGLDRIYPQAHQKHAANLVQNGGFISEFWLSDPFYKSNFLQRNRIIAGLSVVTIVIESGAKGGSLITAKMANDYDREVFAIPGAPSDGQSAGCNELIRTHQAHLLTDASSLCAAMNWSLQERAIPIHELGKTERQILNLMSLEPQMSSAELQDQLAITVGQLQVALLHLELSGLVSRDVLGTYRINNPNVRGL